MAGDSPVFYSVRRRKGEKVPWGGKIEAGGRRADCGMRVLPVPVQGGTSLTDPTAATGTGEGRPLIRRGIRRGTFPPKGRLWAGRALWAILRVGRARCTPLPVPQGTGTTRGSFGPGILRWNFEFCIKTEENLLLTAGGDHGIIRNCGGRGILPFYPMKRPRRRGRGGAPKCSKN